jgi:signal recognition particle subunit SRP54
VLNGSRRKRIAEGSGTTIQEVNRLIKQFEDTRKVMRTVTSGGGKQALRNMQQMRKRR